MVLAGMVRAATASRSISQCAKSALLSGARLARGSGERSPRGPDRIAPATLRSDDAVSATTSHWKRRAWTSLRLWKVCCWRASTSAACSDSPSSDPVVTGSQGWAARAAYLRNGVCFPPDGQATAQPSAALNGPYGTWSVLLGPHPKRLHPSTRGLAVPPSQYTPTAIQCNRTQHALMRIDADDCLHNDQL